MSIKDCPQPDPPELVMRADGYHYQEDEMKDTRRELTDEQLNKELGRYAFAVGVSLNQARHIARVAIAAHVSLNAPAYRDVMRQAPVTVLPDGSAFFTGSFPLPKDIGSMRPNAPNGTECETLQQTHLTQYSRMRCAPVW